MLSAKTKGLFIEKGHFSTLAAVTSSLTRPFKIERLLEFPAGTSTEALRGFVNSLASGKGVRYVPTRVSVYPASRFFRRHTIEQPARAKESTYFTDLIHNQFRIDTEKNNVSVVNAVDGSQFDLTKSVLTQKELLVTGASVEELLALQEQVVSQGIFPECMEMGSLSMVGGLLDYGRYIKLRRPVLALEIEAERAQLFIVTQERLDLCRPIPHGLDSMLPTIQGELGLKDEESARKLLYSNTFDFTETGANLLRKLLKELQSSMGFYEVQTGQSIGHLIVQLLPENLGWVRLALSKALSVRPLRIDFNGWMAAHGITADESVNLDALDQRWLGLFSLFPSYAADASPGVAATPIERPGNGEEA